MGWRGCASCVEVEGMRISGSEVLELVIVYWTCCV